MANDFVSDFAENPAPVHLDENNESEAAVGIGDQPEEGEPSDSVTGEPVEAEAAEGETSEDETSEDETSAGETSEDETSAGETSEDETSEGETSEDETSERAAADEEDSEKNDSDELSTERKTGWVEDPPGEIRDTAEEDLSDGGGDEPSAGVADVDTDAGAEVDTAEGDGDSLASDAMPTSDAAAAACGPASSVRIRSAGLTVNGLHFADWFNQLFRPSEPKHHPTLTRKVKQPDGTLKSLPVLAFPATLLATGFDVVFAHCAELLAPELTVPEFIALLAAIYNETGGTLQPIAERGGMRYFFEPNAAGKVSYNRSPNRPAGDLLRERGVLSDPAMIARWNRTDVYPNPTDAALLAAVAECDFNKFRGRGYIQVTWRSNYQTVVDPLLKQHGYRPSDKLSDAELTKVIFEDPRVGLGMVGRYFASRSGTNAARQAMNAATPDFKPWGRLLNGGDYPTLLDWRCRRLLAALRAAKLCAA